MLHLGNYLLIISRLTEDKGEKGVFHRLQEGAGLTLSFIRKLQVKTHILFTHREISVSFIVSRAPYACVAPHIKCNGRALFPLRDCIQNRVGQFMWRRSVPRRSHRDNQGYPMRPWGRRRRGGLRKVVWKGKLTQEVGRR